MYVLIVLVYIVAVLQTSQKQSLRVAAQSSGTRPKMAYIDVKDVESGKVMDPIFTFRTEDFDIEPEYPPEETPTKTTTTTEKATTTTKNPNKQPEEPDDIRPASCNYNAEEEFEEAKKRVNRGSKRVSQIQCEYNLLEFKYMVLERDRNFEDCKNKTEGATGMIGGKPVQQGEYPHMGAVGWRRLTVAGEDLQYVFKCGSSLISTRFALTAAHCNASQEDRGFAFRTPDIVRFGEVYLRSDSEKVPADAIDVPIRQVHWLPEYKSEYKIYNDIALLELAERVVMSLNVRPACLNTVEDISDIKITTVTGWGRTEKEDFSRHLLYAELYHTEQDDCNKTYKDRIGEKWLGLHKHQFCMGRNDIKVDTCQGDSGGPVQIKKPMDKAMNHTGYVYYVLGVTSGGIKCGWKGIPGIYTKVSDESILCWIEKMVWPKEKNVNCTGDLFRGYQIPIDIVTNSSTTS